VKLNVYRIQNLRKGGVKLVMHMAVAGQGLVLLDSVGYMCAA
jgi:hypothetical protein